MARMVLLRLVVMAVQAMATVLTVGRNCETHAAHDGVPDNNDDEQMFTPPQHAFTAESKAFIYMLQESYRWCDKKGLFHLQAHYGGAVKNDSYT